MLPDIPPQLIGALADTPLVLVLLWLIVQLRRDLARPELPPVIPARAAPDAAHPDTARELVDFKLEVARTYVPLSLIRDLDARLTQQLARFESKLDEVSRAATAAAAVSGHALPPRSIGFGLRSSETQP